MSNSPTNLDIEGLLKLILARIGGLEDRMTKLEDRMTKLEEKVEERLLDTRPMWEALNKRLDHLETRFDQLETRIDIMEQTFHRRFDKVESRLAGMETTVREVSRDLQSTVLRVIELEEKMKHAS
jgi:chromosome segregation ATPase